MRKYTRLLRWSTLIVFMLMVLIPRSAFACPFCFGARVDTPATHGMSMAILALIIITGSGLSGISLFFIQMSRRAKMIESGVLLNSEDGSVRENVEVKREAMSTTNGKFSNRVHNQR